MRSGSQTDGHAKTVAALSNGIISALGNICVIHTTPARACFSSAISAPTSASIWGVSGAPAHRTSWTSLGSWAAARNR